jgi:hypothetical protein
VGRLEAYNSAGELLERYTTKVLTGGSETMTVARPTADIAYVVAYGHLGSGVALDTLVWGPRSSATTNTQGAWSLSSLLTGTYRVKVTPPLGHIVTTPQGGQFEVAYTEGLTVGDLNFGIYNTDNIWHNTALPQNVNADPLYVVNTIDMLVVINWLTINGPGAPLPQIGDPNVIGYLDVNNDKVCNTGDLLNLVNYLTLHPPGGGGLGNEGESGASASGGSGLTGSGEGAGEGEDAAVPLLSISDYFSTHRRDDFGAPESELPCCCAQCLAVRALISPATQAAAETGDAEVVWLGDASADQEQTSIAPLHADISAAARTDQGRNTQATLDNVVVPIASKSSSLPRHGRMQAKTVDLVEELAAAIVARSRFVARSRSR